MMGVVEVSFLCFEADEEEVVVGSVVWLLMLSR